MNGLCLVKHQNKSPPFSFIFDRQKTTLYLAQTLREKTLMTLREAKKTNLMYLGLKLKLERVIVGYALILVG